MKKKTKMNAIMYFIISYLFISAVVSIINQNYEFLYYTFIMSILVMVVASVNKNIKLPIPLIVSLLIIGVMHVLGGVLYFNGVRLYDTWILWNLIRYDNIVHFFGTFTITLITYNLLHPYFKNKKKELFSYLVFILAAMGVGSINEIMELTAVIFLNAAERVGDYMNNAVDLLFNFLGATCACILLFIRKRFIALSNNPRLQE